MSFYRSSLNLGFLNQIFRKTFLYRYICSFLQRRHTRKLALLKQYFWEENVEVLQLFSTALNEAGIVFWLEFGTLLGYYRENDFIAHDCDIDTGTFIENSPVVYRILTKAGFKLVREYHVIDDGGLEQCYQYKHTTIDVFYFRKDKNRLYCNSFLPIKNMTYFWNLYVKRPFLVKRIEVPDTGYRKVQFKGAEVYIPNDCDLYLRTHYGDSYMVPNPKYDGKKDSTNIIYYEYEQKPGYGILKKPYV